MKKACVVLLCVAMAWTLVGCNNYYMNLNGEEDEIWLADDMDFYMMWDADKNAVLGATIIDGVHVDLHIGWSAGFTANEVDVFPYPYPKELYEEDSRLLWGLITKDGKNKYTLTIDSKNNKLFPGYDIISMTKYTESEIEWVDGWPVPIGG